MRHASPTGSIAEKIWEEWGVSICFYSNETFDRHLTTERPLVRGHMLVRVRIERLAKPYRTWAFQNEKGP